MLIAIATLTFVCITYYVSIMLMLRSTYYASIMPDAKEYLLC